MGIGVGLTLVALGAILAFAIEFSLRGIDVQMIGWILMLAGAASMAFTFLYTRPRRRRQVAEVVEGPMYVAEPDEIPPHTHRGGTATPSRTREQELPPGRPEPPTRQPGRYIDPDHPDQER